MTPDRWRLISELFHAARGRDEGDRAAFLAAACVDDPSLRQEIESLLRFDPNKDPIATVAPAADLQPGFVVGNRYRIVSLLGTGAMGEVYRADDLKVGQQVALKFLPAYLAKDANRVQRFVNELRLARQISHPNVCRVYDIEEAAGRPFLSMEYIDGETLASLLKRIGRLPDEKVLEIARQLCAGLSAAHDQGVLHRDLKPANIMIDGRGHARITDFGLAVTVGSNSAGEIAGTPAYMAPEQIVGGPVSAQTDLFALGLILTELISGKRVFQATTVRERSTAREDETAAALASAAGAASPLQPMIAQCLQTNPAARPASVRSVAAAFPGGADPLSAAVAAGQIPSPQMVAAADVARGLRPAAAWACLTLTIAGMLVAVWQLQPMMLYRQVSLTKPPPALVERGQQIIAKLGYSTPPADSAYWFGTAQGYDVVKERSALYGSFVRLSIPPEKAGVLFFYRQSPELLVSENALGVVQFREPPADVPGMADVILDPLGRLVRFSAVPKTSRESSSPREPAWSGPFAEAGLDIGSFTRSETTWIPSVPFDVVAAWEGNGPDNPATRMRVVAAALDGRVVAFDSGEQTFSGGAGSSRRAEVPAGETVFMAMTMAALLGAALLSRWNIRQGRWDRSGALKVSGYVFAIGLLMSALRADHVPIARDEYRIIARLVGWNLYLAGFTFLMYVAFEPSVRRRWPRVLTSWARVLDGRWRDPLVGRDILVGALAGVAIMLLREAEFFISAWLGIAAPSPVTSTLEGLGSWQQFASLALFVQVEALWLALGWVLLLLVMRIVFRRNDVAIVAAIIVVVPITALPGNHFLLGLSIGLLIAALSVFVLLRFGLFSLIVAICVVNALVRLPITLNPSDWYLGRSLIVLLCLSVLIGYGFRTSVAGQPLVRRTLVED
jgi:serine/threonine-protein kinase